MRGLCRSGPFSPHTLRVKIKSGMADDHAGFDMAESVGLEPTRPLTGSQFSKLLPYHSAQLSISQKDGLFKILTA